MKKTLTKRAARLLTETGYDQETSPAICALVAFAAQNSGIEVGNYFSDWRDTNGRRAYAKETRDISADFARFRDALAEASAERVTDADVIAAAPHAFSGRLEWKEGHWEYCTGQYFPTEYRKAAATVVEYATGQVRGSRPPAKRAPRTVAELKELNKENGYYFFTKDSMRFFRSKIESGIIAGKFFVTSEQQDDNTPRRFTIRSFDDEGRIGKVGEFQEHRTRSAALSAVKEAE